MGTARRLYLYSVSAISLLVLAVGLYNLAALVFGRLADAVGASVIGGGPATTREQLSLTIALIAVGAPVFAIHWALVGRGWRSRDAAGVDDRFSPIRAVHLALVPSVALAFAAVAAVGLLSQGFEMLFGIGGARLAAPSSTDEAAMLVVAVPIWWYHQRLRASDIRRDHLTGPAAWLTRLYRYGWAFAGLAMLVTACSSVLGTLASVLIGRPGFTAGDPWWMAPLASSLATIVVGGAIFTAHAVDARSAIRDAALIGEDDRDSRLRAAYFGLVILAALADGAVTVASSLSSLATFVLGAAEDPGTGAFLEGVVGPLLVAVPVVIAGWTHWIAQHREARTRSAAAAGDAERLALHLTAGVGLAALAIGVAQALGRLFEVGVGTTVMSDLYRAEIASYLAAILVGAALWIPAWAVILRRRAETPLTERRATIGRAYLYLVVAGALVAAVPSAAFSLYRLIDTALGGRGLALGSDLAIPVAVVIVASIVGAYHIRLLIGDLRFGVATAPEPGPPRPIVLVPVAPVAPDGPSLSLMLRGPIGADLLAIVDHLREGLPVGVALDLERPSNGMGESRRTHPSTATGVSHATPGEPGPSDQPPAESEAAPGPAAGSEREPVEV